MRHRRQDKTTGEGANSSIAAIQAAPSRSTGEFGPVVVVAGPTASGKSAAALAIAEAFDGVVINADSMQIYRDLPVLTAQPPAADQARAPHRLYGILPAAERCTAGRWRALAIGEIAAAHAQHRLPIIAGGTGLYLKALIEGLAPVPDVPPEIRAEAVSLHTSLGAERFHAELAAHDPVMAARLVPGDTQRVRRAYEVMRATGRSLASYQEETAPIVGQFVPLLLMPPRDALYAACDRRCETMIETGALEDVRMLLAQDLPPELPAMKAVGVRELAQYLNGELVREDAVALFQRATRQYAKRQYTWFRHQLDEARSWAAQFSESLKPEIFSFIRNNIDRLDRAV